MGGTFYSSSARLTRAENAGYFSKSVNEIFEQNQKQEIHESMNPKTITIREARDSANHPNSVPIILALDVTGSMQRIPHYLVKDGLPHIMDGIIQHGIPDPALLFLAVGDTECDRYPLQVGQFESGDLELDTWLTRTYLEGGGGGNAGESYLLAWYFAAKHTVTDAWEKRKQKGFLFTVGDEPCLRTLPQNVLGTLMESVEKGKNGFTDKELLAEAQKTYNVYHLHILQGSAGHRSLSYWKELLGQNCIAVDNYQDVSKIIAQIVVDHADKTVVDTTVKQDEPQSEDPKKTEIIL